MVAATRWALLIPGEVFHPFESLDTRQAGWTDPVRSIDHKAPGSLRQPTALTTDFAAAPATSKPAKPMTS